MIHPADRARMHLGEIPDTRSAQERSIDMQHPPQMPIPVGRTERIKPSRREAVVAIAPIIKRMESRRSEYDIARVVIQKLEDIGYCG